MTMSHVLLACADEVMADLTGIFFRAEGFDFEHVDDAAALAEFVETKRPDVVILDADLPVSSGAWPIADLITLLRQHKIPVMLLSARFAPHDIRTAFAMGVSDFIIKPFMPAELVTRCYGLFRDEAA
jgi:DNA-binding response OmpR family regulator